MIYGIGTDVVQVDRIVDLLARYGDRFARRVLGPDELAEFQRRRSRGGHGPAYSARYLAKRFAAKEAYSKALGLGLRGPMTLLSLQVLNDRRGQPVARPRKALADYVRERGLVAHVSLSDEVDSAVAFVIIEQHSGDAQADPGLARDAGAVSPDARATDRREG
ncbi:MAG: holo-ACP synthase [Limnobacter sp.]|nr:holo-ACP synthase [Limnobacter sp.]